jgi:hypothetical protein
MKYLRGFWLTRELCCPERERPGDTTLPAKELDPIKGPAVEDVCDGGNRLPTALSLLLESESPFFLRRSAANAAAANGLPLDFRLTELKGRLIGLLESSAETPLIPSAAEVRRSASVYSAIPCGVTLCSEIDDHMSVHSL